jgi:hypothetical protein
MIIIITIIMFADGILTYTDKTVYYKSIIKINKATRANILCDSFDFTIHWTNLLPQKLTQKQKQTALISYYKQCLENTEEEMESPIPE